MKSTTMIAIRSFDFVESQFLINFCPSNNVSVLQKFHSKSALV